MVEITISYKQLHKLKKVSNKFDDVNIDNQDFNTYNLLRNNFSKREDLHGVFSKLKLDSKPYVPKPKEDSIEQEENVLEKKFAGIDPSKIKEFVPKNYRVVKKN